MKHYYDTDGIEVSTPPDPFNGRSPMRLPDGSYNDDAFREMGGTITDDGKPTREQEFAAACVDFRAVCVAIGQFLGGDNFHGGFGEMASFASSEAYQANPVLGNTLAIQWSAMNESCKYFGSKIGLGQPEWWYKCWELAGVIID